MPVIAFGNPGRDKPIGGVIRSEVRRFNDGVVLGDGIMLSDGVLLGDGIMLGDGVLIAD